MATAVLAASDDVLAQAQRILMKARDVHARAKRQIEKTRKRVSGPKR